MRLGRLLAQAGETRMGFASEHDGRELKHYRTYRTDLDPAIKRTKQIAQSTDGSKFGEHQYIGSLDRTVIDDWLRKQGKDWHDWATDKELKAKFMAYYRTEFSKLMADTYQERKLTINRTLAARPQGGQTILDNYRKEMAHG